MSKEKKEISRCDNNKKKNFLLWITRLDNTNNSQTYFAIVERNNLQESRIKKS